VFSATQPTDRGIGLQQMLGSNPPNREDNPRLYQLNLPIQVCATSRGLID
jgi:hypothetical protein